ncbi:MAG TPA: ATP-binding protein [Gemmatimonadaceae bacterium]
MAADTEIRAAILVVDDHADQLQALDAILAPLGQPIVRAPSGEDALRQLMRHDFAVILLDVQMSGLSGIETARLIKTRQRSRLIPIIFLTGADRREEALIAGYTAGAVDYIVKPVQPEILRSKVSVFVELYRQQQRIVEQEARLRHSERQQLELRHVHELLQSEAKYREIFAGALDAIVIFDASGKVSMINRAAEQMFGVAEFEAAGSPIDRFVSADVQTLVTDASCEVAGDGRGEPTQNGTRPPRALTAKRGNGEQFPIESSLSCLTRDDERVFTLIVRDVSEQVRQAEALRQQTVELEDALTARNRFFAAASHELRTPINAVLGYTTLLIDEIYGPLNEQQSEALERTEKSTKHLLSIVNDVLDLSKIDAGKLDVTREPIVVPAVIEDLFVALQPLADEHGSTLSIEHEGEPITIKSDERRVRQILLNLLSNAIKFGNGKPIRVVPKLTKAPNGEESVVIEVIDQGIGISEADQQRIFQEFEQVDTTEQGTGLGLSISRRLAERLGGSLAVESAEGKGSTFRLTLPMGAR